MYLYLQYIWLVITCTTCERIIHIRFHFRFRFRFRFRFLTPTTINNQQTPTVGGMAKDTRNTERNQGIKKTGAEATVP